MTDQVNEMREHSRSVLEFHSSVELAKWEGEYVVVDMDSGLTVALDEIGSLIVAMAIRHASFEEVVETILREYSVSRDTASQDVKMFVKRFESLGFTANVKP